jgi:hypothetical protein
VEILRAVDGDPILLGKVEADFFDHISGSPRAARELIHRLSRRLREADDRIVNDERRSAQAQEMGESTDSQTTVELVDNAYLTAKNSWLRSRLHGPLDLGDLPFVVGRVPASLEGRPPLQPNLKLDDAVPFRLSRNHFVIEKLLCARPPQQAWNDRQRTAHRRSFPR